MEINIQLAISGKLSQWQIEKNSQINEWRKVVELGDVRIIADTNSPLRAVSGSVGNIKYIVFGYVSENICEVLENAAVAFFNFSEPTPLKKISGNYILVAIDTLSMRICISGDVCGVIPLYWCVGKSGLYCSSNLGNIVGLLDSRELHEENFFLALSSLALKPNNTLLKGVHSLHGLSALAIDISQGLVEPRVISTSNENLFLNPSNNSIDFHEQAACIANNLTKSTKILVSQGDVLTQISSGLDSANVFAAILKNLGNQESLAYSGLFSGTNIEDYAVIESWKKACPANMKILEDKAVITNLVTSFESFCSKGTVDYPINSHTTFPAMRNMLGNNTRHGIVTGEGGDELFALGPHVLFSLLFTGNFNDCKLFRQLKQTIAIKNQYTASQMESFLGWKGLLNTRGRFHEFLRDKLVSRRLFPGMARTHNHRYRSNYIEQSSKKLLWPPWKYKEVSLLNNLELVQYHFWMEKEFDRAEKNGFDLFHPILEYSNIKSAFEAKPQNFWHQGQRKSVLYESLKCIAPLFTYDKINKGSHFEYYMQLLSKSNQLMGPYKNWSLAKRGYMDASFMESNYNKESMNGYKFHIIPFELFLRSFDE